MEVRNYCGKKDGNEEEPKANGCSYDGSQGRTEQR